MQGLPTNLLTQNVATAAGKVEANSAGGASVLGGVASNKESKVSKNLFAEIFSNLMGNSETKVEGQVEGQLEAKSEGKSEKSEKSNNENTQTTTAESKIDVLLKKKELEKNHKTEVSDLSNEKVLPAEVLNNINNLINRAPVDNSKNSSQINEKISATGSSLDQLLKSLKNENTEVQIEDETEISNNKFKTSNPLDFLLKESTDSKSAKLVQNNPEMVSKLGLSSEEFLTQKSEAKDSKSQIIKNNDETFDLKSFGQTQMNQSMKAYGQKQNLLNDGVIRNTKDLAFSENKKSKSEINELTSPDLKIAADLSLVKEPFIPMMQKNETTQNSTTQDTSKVLDLSKINSSNTTEIIKKISDYIEQSQVANSNTMDLTVKHESLGQFKIQVNKPMGSSNQMDMQITTSTAEGHEFFMKNEIGLMKNLSQAGIQLSDLRIISGGESASFAGNDSKQNSNSQNGANAGREFMSFDTTGDSSQGSDRRRQLWQEARENQQRYGA